MKAANHRKEASQNNRGDQALRAKPFLPPLGSLEFAVVMNADLKYRYVAPVNAKAWAIGRKLKNGRIKVRRIVWGRMLARAERWTGEIITPVRILVKRMEKTSANERANRPKQTGKVERASIMQQSGITKRATLSEQP